MWLLESLKAHVWLAFYLCWTELLQTLLRCEMAHEVLSVEGAGRTLWLEGFPFEVPVLLFLLPWPSRLPGPWNVGDSPGETLWHTSSPHWVLLGPQWLLHPPVGPRLSLSPPRDRNLNVGRLSFLLYPPSVLELEVALVFSKILFAPLAVSSHLLVNNSLYSIFPGQMTGLVSASCPDPTDTQVTDGASARLWAPAPFTSSIPLWSFSPVRSPLLRMVHSRKAEMFSTTRLPPCHHRVGSPLWAQISKSVES